MKSALLANGPHATETQTCAGLLEHLLAHHERITYANAARTLVINGGRSDRMDVAGLFRLVARERAGTRVGSHQVGLDTLIVSAASQEPSAPHWKSPRTYSRDDWRALFGQWAICEHFAGGGARRRTPAVATENTVGRQVSADINPPRKIGRAVFFACASLGLLAAIGGIVARQGQPSSADGQEQLTNLHHTSAEPLVLRGAAPADTVSGGSVTSAGHLLDSKFVAVLEFRDQTSRNLQLAKHLTDRVRILLAQSAPTAKVTTRENVVALAGGRELNELEGDGDIDTARKIGADDVVSGDLRIIGKQFALTLQLHDAASAQLIGGAAAYGNRTVSLDAALEQAVATLVRDHANAE